MFFAAAGRRLLRDFKADFEEDFDSEESKIEFITGMLFWPTLKGKGEKGEEEVDAVDVVKPPSSSASPTDRLTIWQMAQWSRFLAKPSWNFLSMFKSSRR